MLEINDKDSLTAYVGFFSLLWLTWYQVSLYDVRFSADSIFERTAKAIHFGVMVGFAVIGPQWKPGQAQWDYKIYKAFGLILMVSRLTLFAQYGVTIVYNKKYKIAVLPILLIMASTPAAAILYGALTPAFPDTTSDVDSFAIEKYSNAYIAWYIIAISETILTVAVSCVPRCKAISFKGTHMVQGMSLLSLIILEEVIIVICNSISKIVKNEFLWSAAVVGQIIAAVLIIYWCYSLYFDCMQEKHLDSIKQQMRSFLHFPLHLVLVLILQGILLLIIRRQAVEAVNGWEAQFLPAIDWLTSIFENTDNASHFPEGSSFACWVANSMFYNGTVAQDQFLYGYSNIAISTLKTLFDSFSVTVSKSKNKTKSKTSPDLGSLVDQYYDIFDLVMTYTFIAGGLALILIAALGILSLPKHGRRIPSTSAQPSALLSASPCAASQRYDTTTDR
ncbi:hypothetical protein E8E12_001201 [Didymella heteroderae]|uniref:Uncharacterized protein n=1 Tax=Didymella heteroderae TaxID=1769908 RepID=A0A9P4WM30_9PLEO|nr:hypothetical protein E8E12_001201 [Didymella heteroderae]